jgi:hypothetical protein
MQARRPWLLAVATWWSRHRRRWRRRHLRAVDGGARRTLADIAERPARSASNLHPVESAARWQSQRRKPRPDGHEPGAA